MKIKILETSKTTSPIFTGDIVDIGLKIKNNMKFYVLAAPEAGKMPISSDVIDPTTPTEVTNFTFYNPTPYLGVDIKYIGAQSYNGVAGTYYEFTTENVGIVYPSGILLPQITTNNGNTLDAVYTVYNEQSEIWQSGQTFDTINKTTITANQGITWTIEGQYANLGTVQDNYTFVNSTVLSDNDIFKTYYPVELDIRAVKFKYESEYPSTYNESSNIRDIYIPRLNSVIKSLNTSAFNLNYGSPLPDIAGQYNYLIPMTKLANNFLIQIKDKFFTYYDRLNYQKQGSDIPEYLAGSGWDLDESMAAGYRSPLRTQIVWQKNSLLNDYCFGMMPDDSILGISFTGNMYWNQNNLIFNITANGNDTDVVIGPESISGIEGYPYPKYDWIYYDWTMYGVDESTNEMVQLGVAFNQQSEEVWEKLDNFSITLNDGAYGEYIQPGKKIIILCKAYTYKRSLSFAVNGAGDACQFEEAFYGGIDPITGCWEGVFDYVPNVDEEPPSWEFQQTPAIKANWAWSYITVPEQGTATFQNPLPVLSENIETNSFLLFYDGVTADSSTYPFTSLTQSTTDGRLPSATYEAMGARFMPFVTLSDPYFLDETRTTGWTTGSPYDYVTKKEVLGLVESLKLQGITRDTDCYAYINWHEDSRDFILFPNSGVNVGYTGPANATQAQQHTILARTMASVLVGGTGTDGITFNGLKTYFPNVKWGFADHPKWAYYFTLGDVSPTNSYNISNTQKTQIMNRAADVFLSDPELADAIDMLMPHAYSVVNNRDFTRRHSEQCVELCKIVNEKLVALGKQPKKIVPLVSPIYLTDQTTYPYTIFNYQPAFPNHQYVPPNTIMLNDDIIYEQADPVVRSGADGAMIWLSTAFRSRQILGRPQSSIEDVAPGTINGPTYSPDGIIPIPYSYKSTSRQAISAHENYIKGVCMGITGNRWWWSTEVPGSTAYTPKEWLPLGTNKAYPTAGATSGITAIQLVERILEDVKTRTINIFNDLVDFYSNG